MIKNFKIMDAVALSFEDGYFDLHNDFKITRLKNNGQDLAIIFSSLKDDERNGSIELIFHEFSYFESDVFPLTSECLFISEMGYKNPDDMDCDWLLSEKSSVAGDHLFFRFDADRFLRIFARHAEVRIF
ncbi:MAG: hypothetical protein EON54_10175 [Alcaligenaceae bacterium]|nr:MAG: hypothetical protein EON54_10175 [Alcaligenaceae bacterium]